jgi:hypothetical protein
MITSELVLDETAISVPRIDLFLKFCRFLNGPAYAKSPYRVQSSVTHAALKQFCGAIQGELLVGTWGNAGDLASLCTE